mgnify:CR=1 FL=1
MSLENSRVLKFRAWDSNINQMVYLSQNHSIGHLNDLPMWEVMQFTGLFDKNGKEIFEGDIIKFTTKWSHPTKQLGVISYYPESMQYGFSLGQSYYDFTDLENNEILEIIGNIYENPELQKKYGDL